MTDYADDVAKPRLQSRRKLRNKLRRLLIRTSFGRPGLDGRIHGVFRREPPLNPCVQSAEFNSPLAGDINSEALHTVDGNKESISLILPLVRPRNPSAIGGGVVAIDIDTLDCERIGIPRSECPVPKTIEAIAPFVTNTDPAPAVRAVGAVLGFLTTGNHPEINSVKPCLRTSVRASFPNIPAPHTPKRVSTPESLALDASFPSAGAKTTPVVSPNVFEHGPRTDLFPGKINKGRTICPIHDGHPEPSAVSTEILQRTAQAE